MIKPTPTRAAVNRFHNALMMVFQSRIHQSERQTGEAENHGKLLLVIAGIYQRKYQLRNIAKQGCFYYIWTPSFILDFRLLFREAVVDTLEIPISSAVGFGGALPLPLSQKGFSRSTTGRFRRYLTCSVEQQFEQKFTVILTGFVGPVGLKKLMFRTSKTMQFLC